jgi:hypothetical protein
LAVAVGIIVVDQTIEAIFTRVVTITTVTAVATDAVITDITEAEVLTTITVMVDFLGAEVDPSVWELVPVSLAVLWPV